MLSDYSGKFLTETPNSGGSKTNQSVIAVKSARGELFFAGSASAKVSGMLLNASEYSGRWEMYFATHESEVAAKLRAHQKSL
eukprot:COSAG01_NODE_8086_length_2925_cov_12.218684_6_plen_82_part_00